MNTLPKDPVMLLSFVNTQLRDHYPSLEEFAATYQIDAAEVISCIKNYRLRVRSGDQSVYLIRQPCFFRHANPQSRHSNIFARASSPGKTSS